MNTKLQIAADPIRLTLGMESREPAGLGRNNRARDPMYRGEQCLIC
jgi:hypothetical protein